MLLQLAIIFLSWIYVEFNNSLKSHEKLNDIIKFGLKRAIKHYNSILLLYWNFKKVWFKSHNISVKTVKND